MTRRPGQLTLSCATALTLFMFGCSKEPAAPAPAPAPVEQPVAVVPTPAPVEGAVATAQVVGAEGSGISGTVTFRDTGNGITLEAKFSGLSAGAHGFHVHETGACSGDFSGAAGHFNPGGHAHAGPDAAEAHAGDLGNLLVAGDGSAQITMLSRRFTLDESPTGIIGRSVILHAEPDDLTTQPTGNSGARIACGVIVLQAAASAGETGAANH